mgnify:CR=1 FL=1
MNSYVIENFLTEEQEQKIHNLTLDPNFSWFYTPGTIVEIIEGKQVKAVFDVGINPYQFVHPVNLSQCKYIETIAPVMNQLSVEFQSNIRILRCKFNFLPKNSDNTYHYPHVDDSEQNVYTAIYYVNDSDGDTYFFDEDLNVTNTITPKKGRMVLFDSNKFHSSSSPINSEYRIVMNTVFKLLSEET